MVGSPSITLYVPTAVVPEASPTQATEVLIMDALDVVLAVEQGSDEYDEDQILAGIAEHRATLRQLQGSWGRLIQRLEDQELIPPE